MTVFPSVLRSIWPPLINKCSCFLVNYRYPSVLFPQKTLLTIEAYQTQSKPSIFPCPPWRLSMLPGRMTWMKKECLCLSCCLRESWWCLNAYSEMTIIAVVYKYWWINSISCWIISWRKHSLNLLLSIKPNSALPRSHKKIRGKKAPEQRGRLVLS